MSWSWSIDLFSLDLLAFAKNLFIPGPMVMARFLVRREVLSHLVVAACAEPFLLDVLLTMVLQVELGIALLASKSLSANAGSTHQFLSLPG